MQLKQLVKRIRHKDGRADLINKVVNRVGAGKFASVQLEKVFSGVLKRTLSDFEKGRDSGQLAELVDLIARSAEKLSRNCNVNQILFERAQNLGIHILPVHFYSPVPDTRSLQEPLWSKSYQKLLNFDLEAQLEFLKRISRWGIELKKVPLKKGEETEYYWENPAFCAGDATVYYSIIREFKPKRILEVGSGFSTLIASQAASLNRKETGGTQVDCIEPYPMALLKNPENGVRRLIEKPVQEVGFEVFEELEEGDIFFIDSTHVSKAGSDVNFLFLEVLPRLKPGVLVHVHDIFLPSEFPKAWVLEHRLFWNEHYLVAAFLAFNSDFEVLVSNAFVGAQASSRAERLFASFPAGQPFGGSSLWLRRKKKP